MGLVPILLDQIFSISKELHAAGTTIFLETGKITLSGTGIELTHSSDVQKAYLGG